MSIQEAETPVATEDLHRISIEQATAYLSDEGKNAEDRRSYLKGHVLDILPSVIDEVCGNPSLHLPGPQPETERLLGGLLMYGSPKELCLSLEEQLKVAADEVAQCFHLDEDLEIREEQQEEREEDLDQFLNHKTFKNVCGRVITVLGIHERVICRLEYKKSSAGLIMIGNFVERLDYFIGELMQALYAGEAIAVAQSRGLLVSLAVWCRAVTLWAAQLRLTIAESKDLEVKLADLLLKFFVLLHSRLGLDLLNRGFLALFPDAMLTNRITNVSSQNEHELDSLIACKQEVTESLAVLGLSAEGHSLWMIGNKRNNADGRHIYYPTAALVLTTWHLVDWLCGTKEEQQPVIRALQGHIDLLTVSLPILGSALNGIAKDAGHMWTWYIAQQMQSHGVSADMNDTSMLLELVMPNMADDPSDTTRFALHRLVGTLLSLVDYPNDRIQLYRQILAPENPFSAVRLSSLALLREEISSMKAKATSLPDDDAFWTALAPILFTIPVLDVPLNNVALDMALDDLMIPWSTECAKILLLLLSSGSKTEQHTQAYVEQQSLMETWIVPLTEAIGRWEKEVPITTDPDVLEASMLLYSLGWTLAQIQGRMSMPTTK